MFYEMNRVRYITHLSTYILARIHIKGEFEDSPSGQIGFKAMQFCATEMNLIHYTAAAVLVYIY